jgi:phosphoglycerate dehydrogenase-like enzyme
LKLVVLDDYLGTSEDSGALQRLADFEVQVIRSHLELPALTDALQDAAVVMAMRERTPFPREVLGRLPALQLLVTTGMSNAAIDLGAAREAGIIVCGTSMVASSNTAELTWGLVLSLVRNIPDEILNVRAGGWQQKLGRDLSGMRLGVVGLGRVGARVAAFGAAFGMNVVAWSPHLTPERAAPAGATAVSRSELFSTSDVISLHLVLSDTTRHVVGADELALMKPSSYLINTSRGPLIDGAALAAALTEGAIAGAALDVFDTEPWPTRDPLRSAPNLLATPHLGYVTDRVMTHWYTDAVEDVLAWRLGSPIRVIEA